MDYVCKLCICCVFFFAYVNVMEEKREKLKRHREGVKGKKEGHSLEFGENLDIICLFFLTFG